MTITTARACAAAMFAVMAWTMPVRAADPAFPVGSRIGLVPPAGMVVSKQFMGFEDQEKTSAILLVTYPAVAFDQLDKSMVPETMKKQGVEIEKREPIQLGSGKGFLLSGKQTVGTGHFRKYLLVAAIGNLTALVTVQVPEQDKSYTDKAVHDALATLTVRDVPDSERMSLLPFTIGDLAGFRIDDILPGRAAMLVDKSGDQQAAKLPAGATAVGGVGATSGQPIDARFLIAVLEGGPNDITKNADEFARVIFQQIAGIKEVRIQDAEPLRIGGKPGYETLANAKDPKTDDDLRVVQWLRFGGGAYMQMVGVARASVWLDVFPRLRKMRDSIDVK